MYSNNQKQKAKMTSFCGSDSLVIIPVGLGFIVTESECVMDGGGGREGNDSMYWSDGVLDFGKNKKKVFAFSNIQEVCEMLMHFYSDWESTLKEESKKKHFRKIPPPLDIEGSGEPRKDTEKASAAEKKDTGKAKKAKRNTGNICTDIPPKKPKKKDENINHEVLTKLVEDNEKEADKFALQADGIKRKVVGYMCRQCGESYKTEPEVCTKCFSNSFEEIIDVVHPALQK